MIDKIFKNLQKSVYPYVPVFAQNLGISIFGLYWYKKRFGGNFFKNVQAFKSSDLFVSRPKIHTG